MWPGCIRAVDNNFYWENGLGQAAARLLLGIRNHTKTHEFSEKFQTAFDPPSFSKNHIADFATKVSDFLTKVRMLIMAGLLHII